MIFSERLRHYSESVVSAAGVDPQCKKYLGHWMRLRIAVSINMFIVSG